MAYNRKKILVTGSAGLIGRALYSFLESQGHNVVGVDNHSRFCNHGVNKSHNEDLSTFLSNTVNDFDMIYHMAAINGTSSFYSKPTEVLTNNLLCDLNVFDFAKSNPSTKLIYASSSEVVSGTNVIPTPELVDVEIRNIHNARWSYRLPKIVAENYLFNSDIDFVIFRFFNVYSEHAGQGHFLKDIVDKIKKGSYELISPNETRSFCHVEDILEPMVFAAETKSRQVYNLGSTEEITIEEAANTIASEFGIDPCWTVINSHEGSASRRQPDISKIKKEAGDFKIRKFKEVIKTVLGKMK